jgi:Fic family protein
MQSFIAGTYTNQGTYKSFEPNLINREWHINDMALINLLTQADRALGKLDMYSHYIPNINLFIRMHIAKEANQSSKIEGTQTNMEEVLMEQSEVSSEKRNDWQEVQNYIKAINTAIENLAQLPFSSRLIKKAHKVLLQSVRGEHKLPGEFRSSQNWIGGPNIATASFVPPAHSGIQVLMADMEKLVHDDNNQLPHLLKIALLHYQFETIHPFLDGNGRIGRLMITLYLVEKGLLSKPILYLSDFLEKNRMHYYDNLSRVREKNDLLHWFKFFLTGIVQTAENSIKTFDAILRLEKQTNEKIKTLGKRMIKAQAIINYLYQQPIINAQKVQTIIGSKTASAYSLLEDLERLEIVKETTGFQRNRIYVFEDYLKLFR